MQKEITNLFLIKSICLTQKDMKDGEEEKKGKGYQLRMYGVFLRKKG